MFFSSIGSSILAINKPLPPMMLAHEGYCELYIVHNLIYCVYFNPAI